ncbi:MAG: BamA/TamA family outer membrane protein [Flavisolibacter sp.]|nr:BamA/TamA family outer membrane protein [Flavisolibacter sp.]
MTYPAATHKRHFISFAFVVLVILFTSCATVRHYPPNKPFVFNTNINLEGRFTTAEKKDLQSRLQQQLHDSIRVRRVQKLIFWQTLRNPPVYDSLNADKSVLYMKGLLHAQGYYRDSITYDTTLQILEDQYRTTVNFNVVPGKLYKLDSIVYNMEDDTLQQITLAAQKESLLKRDAPFSKSLISSELDRLTDVYRNNGYLRFTREEMLAVWDTIGLALIRPTLDPIEQIRQLEQLRRRRENPTADLEIRLRGNEDSTRLIRYHVGNVVIYPDVRPDTARFIPFQTTVNDYTIIYHRNLFKPSIITENVYLHRGDLYSQRNYLKTLNRFNAIGAWRLVNIDQLPRPGMDTVDFAIRLTPARKYSFDINLEGSRNTYNVFSEGNLLGVGVNMGFQNRNFARAANQANTNFRFGTELNARKDQQIVQTKQITVSNTIFFPRLAPRARWIPTHIKENVRTSLTLNAGNTDRVNFFNLTSLNASWGYEFNWKNKLLGLRLPNIEYAYLIRRRLLDTLINRNASYAYIFNKGLITSAIGNFTITGGQRNITRRARFNVEGSGLLIGFIHTPFLDSNLYRFIKLDGEFRQTHNIRRTAFAWRAFAGIGYELPSSRNRNNQFLPFYKQYYAGGPNSMRAWRLRRLGPGSTLRSFSRTTQQIVLPDGNTILSADPERFGDIQLELNGEYRFYITEIGGMKINSVLFVDMGNVWFLRRNEIFPGGEFKLNKFAKDIAIGAGTGLRLDFGYFLARFDYGWKVKNPTPDAADAGRQNKWFADKKGELQFGINYPF